MLQMGLEVANMTIECCSQERTYLRFYGLLGERFCKLKPAAYQAPFDEVFVKWYVVDCSFPYMLRAFITSFESIMLGIQQFID
jgi:hypothetical protein